MMLVVKGDFDEVKRHIKTLCDTYKKELSEIKKRSKKLYKNGVIPSNVQAKMEELQRLINFYSVSKMQPVNVEGVIVDYKLYRDFVKKLKGFRTETFIQSDGVSVQYWKPNRHDLTAELHLHDLTPYFSNFPTIPNAVIDDDGQET